MTRTLAALFITAALALQATAQDRWRRARSGKDEGASLAEYVFLISIVVGMVIVIGAIILAWLTGKANSLPV